MERLAVGTIVSVHFPFSDLSGSKVRPALAVADAGRDDFILCQITSKVYGDPKAIPLRLQDFKNGKLSRDSYIRPGKIFTANSLIVSKKIGELKPAYFQSVIDAIVEIIRGT
jgi:mRNA interferase MazF